MLVAARHDLDRALELLHVDHLGKAVAGHERVGRHVTARGDDAVQVPVSLSAHSLGEQDDEEEQPQGGDHQGHNGLRLAVVPPVPA